MIRNLLGTVLIVATCFSSLGVANRGDQIALRECLQVWGKHPFSKSGDLKYRTLKTNVKIMGIGKDPTDDKKTSKPALVLIKPSVNVLTKTTFRLLNPNGWYCFKANVTVLGKSRIKLACKAKLASKNSGVEVIGSNEADAVTVLGKTVIDRVGCAD